MHDGSPKLNTEREIFPHEELYNSITHLEESALAALIELRQQITGEGENDPVENAKSLSHPTLQSVIRNSPERIFLLNQRLFDEIERIRESLYTR